MSANTDPQRRPVLYDLRNQRLLADPVGAGPYTPVELSYAALPSVAANAVLGRYGGGGEVQPLSADVTLQLLNTATSQVLDAARVTSATTVTAGVVRLSESVTSISNTTAATSNALKTTYDLALLADNRSLTALNTANNALSRAGGIMTGAITFAPGQTISGYVATADVGVSVQGYDADTAKTDVVQTFSVAQRGAISAQGAVSGTVTLDLALANHFSMSLPTGGTVTLANPTNQVAGQSGAIVVTQNGVTAAVMAFGSFWKFQGGAPAISSTLGSVNVIVYFVESATRITAHLLTNTVA